MPVVSGSLLVEAPIDVAFRVTHDVLAWPSSNPLVKSVEVLEREGSKVVFRMTHKDGRAWNTALFAIPELNISFAERLEPQSPLECMQYVRHYRAVAPTCTEITEEVRFELVPASGLDEAEVISRIRAHMAEVQPHLKDQVEASARSLRPEKKEVSHVQVHR